MTEYTIAKQQHSMRGNSMSKHRRGRGEGAIYPVRRGGQIVRWASAVELGHVAGKRRRKVVYGRTRKEVSEKLKHLHYQQHTGVLTAADKLTTGAYLQAWLEADTRRRPTTIETYRRIITTHIIPAIGGIRLDRLTSDDVANMLARMTRDGIASTASQARRILNCAFREALDAKPPKMAYNPVAGTKTPKFKPKNAYVLNEDEALRLAEACNGERFGIAVLFGLCLGIRQGEIKGLRWSDVDWECGTIRIERTARRVNGQRGTGPTKSESGERELPLIDLLRDALRSHQEAQGEEFYFKGIVNRDDLIVASQAATMYDTANYLRAFRAILAKAGLPTTIRPHDLRHSVATMLIANGVDPKAAASILGHATVEMTMDIYARTTPAQRRAAAETMGRVVKVPNTGSKDQP